MQKGGVFYGKHSFVTSSSYKILLMYSANRFCMALTHYSANRFCMALTHYSTNRFCMYGSYSLLYQQILYGSYFMIESKQHQHILFSKLDLIELINKNQMSDTDSGEPLVFIHVFFVFILQQASQIEGDLRSKSQAYNNLKGNLQNLERKAT